MLLFLACAAVPTDPGPLWTAPDAARDGLAGSDGPFGAASVRYAALARATDVVDATVFYPSDADGWPDPAALPAPTALFVQGGSVATERYRWLAAHLATRGYATVLAEHPRELAFFQPDNSVYAWDRLGELAGEPGTLQGLIDPDAPALVAGHSLGAVVAAGLWADDPRLGGVAMLAGYPAGGVDVAGRAGSPALALTGETDGSAPVDTIADNLTEFEDPFLFAVVDGMNHFAWTDDASAADLEGDGPLEGELDAVRDHALGVLDPWMDAAISADAAALAALSATTFEGVEIR